VLYNYYGGEKELKYDQIYNGQPYKMKADEGLLLACCDCSLVHRVRITIDKLPTKTKAAELSLVFHTDKKETRKKRAEDKRRLKK
jgi:hypothetical protein